MVVQHELGLVVVLVIYITLVTSEEAVVFRLVEEAPADTPVGNLAERLRLDLQQNDDSSSQPKPTYQLHTKKSYINDMFKVDKVTSAIRTRTKLDRDSLCKKHEECCSNTKPCRLEFYVNAMPSYVRYPVAVELQDINDNQPTFPQPVLQLQVPESARLGEFSVNLPVAEDNDNFGNGVQSYMLVHSDDTFRISTTRSGGILQPRLVLSKRIDRELKDQYIFTMIAVDGGSPRRTGSVTVKVRITDTNDNAPKFTKDTYSVLVSEDTHEGEKILQIKATDADIEGNGQLFYSLASTATKSIHRTFRINRNTGDITLRKRLDYEKKQEYQIPVIVVDNPKDKSQRLTASAMVEVRVKDTNDEVPVISMFGQNDALPKTHFTILENGPPDQFVAFVEAEDRDSGPNGQVECELLPSMHPRFQLIAMSRASRDGSRGYQLRTSQPLDREEKAREEITIICRDNGRPQKTNRTTAVITVTDLNDNSPVFEGNIRDGKIMELHVPENKPANYPVAKITARDADNDGRLGRGSGSGSVRYSLDAEGQRNFNIDPLTGQLTTKRMFDREKNEQLRMFVTAEDRGKPSRSTKIQVNVIVDDVNDERPQFSSETVEFEVVEGGAPRKLVGMVHATDKDAGDNGKFTYYLSNSQVPFTVGRHSGEVRTRQQLDREEESRYQFVVTAKDMGSPPLTSAVKVIVRVRDLNDHQPRFIFPSRKNNTVKTSYKNSPGSPIATILAQDGDSGANAKLWYFIASGDRNRMFEMVEDRGQLMIRRRLKLSEVGRYRLTIEVKDSGVVPKSASVDLVVEVENRPADQNVPPGWHNPGPPRAPPQNADRNLVLVIGLVAVASVLAVAFIIIIIWLRKRPLGPRHGAGARGFQTGKNGEMLRMSRSNFPYMSKDTGDGHSDARFNTSNKLSRSVLSSPVSDRPGGAPVGTMLPLNCVDQDSGHGSQEHLHHLQQHQLHLASKTLPPNLCNSNNNSTDGHYYRIPVGSGNSAEAPYYTTGRTNTGHMYQVLEPNSVAVTMPKATRPNPASDPLEENEELLASDKHTYSQFRKPELDSVSELSVAAATAASAADLRSTVVPYSPATVKHGTNKPYSVFTSSFV